MTLHEEARFWAHYGYTETPVIYCEECSGMHEALNDKELSS